MHPREVAREASSLPPRERTALIEKLAALLQACVARLERAEREHERLDASKDERLAWIAMDNVRLQRESTLRRHQRSKAKMPRGERWLVQQEMRAIQQGRWAVEGHGDDGGVTLVQRPASGDGMSVRGGGAARASPRVRVSLEAAGSPPRAAHARSLPALPRTPPPPADAPQPPPSPPPPPRAAAYEWAEPWSSAEPAEAPACAAAAPPQAAVAEAAPAVEREDAAAAEVAAAAAAHEREREALAAEEVAADAARNERVRRNHARGRLLASLGVESEELELELAARVARLERIAGAAAGGGAAGGATVLTGRLAGIPAKARVEGRRAGWSSDGGRLSGLAAS